MLMTNMTFTKGVGTPIYMSPEILDRKHYKKPADIFSFAITMYECFEWTEAYPPTSFKFPWKIAEFVSSGQRLEIGKEMSEEQYNLICNCWKQEPKERIQIDEVVDELEKMIEKKEN